jgi:hypothetical protein
MNQLEYRIIFLSLKLHQFPFLPVNKHINMYFTNSLSITGHEHNKENSLEETM